jgi:hypothetical protein
LQEQLGLRLVQKKRQIAVVVIDDIEKTLTENGNQSQVMIKPRFRFAKW